MTSVEEYWETRYAKGDSSGEGSVGPNRAWKWAIIEKYVSSLDDVVDIGCGDLRFWEGRDCHKYFGLDLSATVIQRNRESRPKWRFEVGHAEYRIPNLRARIVLCLDMLFHIMDDEVFVNVLENLCRYSKEWIFTYTWRRNPFLFWAIKNAHNVGLSRTFAYLRGTDGKYQKYRTFGKYFWIFERQGFTLLAKHGHGDGAMYVFLKSR